MQITQHLSYMAKTSAKTYFYRYNELSLSHKATIKNLQSIKYILVYTNRIISNKLQLAPLYISCFCKNAFLYWNKPCRMLTEHKYYLKSITKIVKYTLLKYFRKFSFINFCMVIPFFIPYKIAPFFVKIIWKLYPKLIS